MFIRVYFLWKPKSKLSLPTLVPYKIYYNSLTLSLQEEKLEKGHFVMELLASAEPESSKVRLENPSSLLQTETSTQNHSVMILVIQFINPVCAFSTSKNETIIDNQYNFK